MVSRNKRAQWPWVAHLEKSVHATHKTALMMDLTALSIRLNMELISNKKIFFMFSQYKLCDPRGVPMLWPQGHNLNEIGRGLLDDATYQIPRL